MSSPKKRKEEENQEKCSAKYSTEGRGGGQWGMVKSVCCATLEMEQA